VKPTHPLLDRIWIVTAAGALVLCAGACTDPDAPGRPQTAARVPDSVYVGTPYDIISRMLKLAQVKETDLVYDLGCGDGRMIVLAAQKYGCRGAGFDIDPERVAASRDNVRRNRAGRLVRIEQADLFELDFSAADVLSLYLLPTINQALLPKFERLKPGTRLVFHNYGLEGIEPDQRIDITSQEDGAAHTLYLYTTPLRHTPGQNPPPTQ